MGAALLMIVVALAAHHWQILDLKEPKVHTSIGLWKTCSTVGRNSEFCNWSKADGSSNVMLYTMRVISILSVVLLIVAIVAKSKKVSFILLAIAALLSSAAIFIYSTQLENFFSRNFDGLMYSEYGCCYYLQAGASLFLIVAMFLELFTH
jgi:hypothetical protein